jgi:putative transposase
MKVVEEVRSTFGVAPACEAVGLSRATWYRRLKPHPSPQSRRSGRELAPEEQQNMIDLLHEDRFVDLPPIEVHHLLLKEGRFICSVRTMYRILKRNQEVRERRALRRHPTYQKPELLAERPNQLWSWDITRLNGPRRWTYFQLYVILDVYSRYIVGWMVADKETAVLAEELIATACFRHGISPDQLTLHADRGTSMTSKTVALLLTDLCVIKTHSRPHVSDDNPYSEANFKTLKYRPGFPKRFGSIEDARSHVDAFVSWYNEQHHHCGINYLTPHDLHYGHGPDRLRERQAVLDAAYERHPERFVKGRPSAGEIPAAAWINKPPKTKEAATE